VEEAVRLTGHELVIRVRTCPAFRLNLIYLALVVLVVGLVIVSTSHTSSNFHPHETSRIPISIFDQGENSGSSGSLFDSKEEESDDFLFDSASFSTNHIKHKRYGVSSPSNSDQSGAVKVHSGRIIPINDSASMGEFELHLSNCRLEKAKKYPKDSREYSMASANCGWGYERPQIAVDSSKWKVYLVGSSWNDKVLFWSGCDVKTCPFSPACSFHTATHVSRAKEADVIVVFQLDVAEVYPQRARNSHVQSEKKTIPRALPPRGQTRKSYVRCAKVFPFRNGRPFLLCSH